jgi:hypothetical protein
MKDRGVRRYRNALLRKRLRDRVERDMLASGCIDRYGETSPHKSAWYEKTYIVGQRRRAVVNDGRRGRRCYDCGVHACSWCVEDRYRKHRRKSEALDADRKFWIDGDYDDMDCE